MIITLSVLGVVFCTIGLLLVAIRSDFCSVFTITGLMLTIISLLLKIGEYHGQHFLSAALDWWN